WGTQGIDNPAFKMAFMACFNVDEFKKFVFESTFLSRFNVHRDRVSQMQESDVELMKFGFDWIKFFLTGKGPFMMTPSKDDPI
ncbi:MAG: YkgJ family cysteine cluster protein, partial [Desulfobacteraceae bacterium]|nr:YkgJ family cysteine cluster protein [Desulfobacteraceae bacterium]